MYFLIENSYVGPNSVCDADYVEICLKPAVGNASRETRLEGWCGTTNDWSCYAHGEYETLEDARAAITEIFGPMRESTVSWYDGDTVEIYKHGAYAPLSADATLEWAYDGICADVDSSTTDAEIAVLVRLYETIANSEGYTLDTDLAYFMRKFRDEIRL